MCASIYPLLALALVSSVASEPRKSVELAADNGDSLPPAALTASILSNPDCVRDVDAALMSRRCEPVEAFKKSDFAMISCLTNVAPPDNVADDGKTSKESKASSASGLSPKCEHVIWELKVKLSNDDNFLKDIREACPEDMPQFEECLTAGAKKATSDNLFTGNGRVLSCVIELKNDPTRHLLESCSTRINQIESVVFSDYRLMGGFVEKCHDDIVDTKCGRVEDKDSYTSQGKVIECLSEHLPNLTQPCRNKIFQVAEYQGDDYHLDRTLFLACKRDRHNLCAAEKAGEGRVFECLMKNKLAPEMSKRCRMQLTRRQKLIAEDYKVSRGLAFGCREEIRSHKCEDNLGKRDHVNVKLAQILLCLEDVIRNGEGEVGGICRMEMKEHRRLLMEDFQVSPEIVDACRGDIKNSCGKMTPGGETLHCLMRVAAQHMLEARCESALAKVLKEADVASDWNVDPILQKNCQSAVKANCDTGSSNEVILSCLMSAAAHNSQRMSRECKNTLVEIQYFLARDFSLNPQLYGKCHKDAERLCHAKDDWHVDKDNNNKLVFSCLVRYLYVDEEEDPKGSIGEISEECADEVEAVLEQRAVSVNLHPEMEEACRATLVSYCGARVGPGEEVSCLQDHMDILDSDCRKAVEQYSKMESRNVMLNGVVATACLEVIQQQCKEGLQSRDEGKVMHCLIKLKTEGDLLTVSHPNCATAVEHWQILTLRDWTFSPTFKRSCQKDIHSLCHPIPRTKIEVLTCLSQSVQKDLLEDAKVPKVSVPCRAELRFELLQKHSDVRLNPELEEECSRELKKFCQTDMTLDCLKQQEHKDLGEKCRILIFKEEKEEAVLNEVDPVLMRKCANEIGRHCRGQMSPNGILECLEENREDPNFDPKCRQVVIRRIVQEMNDYRLNPRLQKACAADLPKFCAKVIYAHKDEVEKDFLEGKVIQCLKDKFVESDDKLTKTCRGEVENLLRNAAVDIRANPLVVKACPRSIQFCREATNTDKAVMGDGGKVEECLKDLFQNKSLGKLGDDPECIMQVARVIEAAASDVKVDHVLFEACSLDLSKFCRDVNPGSGQQVTCLRNVAEDHGLRLEPKCMGVLSKRLEMYEMALKAFPLRGVKDVYESLAKSQHRNYFLLMGLSFLGAVFVIGLLCGRVTKRVRRDLKNK